MLAQLVYLSVSDDNRETLVAEALANARESLKEPGVLRFDVLQQVDNPNLLLLYELYESPEVLVAHQQTAHFKRWQENAIPLLTKPREKLLYTPLES